MSKEKSTILVVEDNPDDQVLTIRALKNASPSSTIVLKEDGQSALDYLFDADSPDLDALRVILLDFKLPRVNGLEVLKCLRSCPDTDWLPVVMVTSSDEPQELKEAYRLGVNSFITKQLDYKQFSEQMKVLAEYWLTVNRVPVASTSRSFGER